MIGFRKSRPLFVLINIFGGLTIAVLIIWETGLDPFKLWQHATTPRPITVSKMQARAPTEARGITPLTPKGNDSSISPVPLKLLQIAVRPGPSPTEGTAQIGVFRESPRTYQAGAILENGARIAELHADYIVLEKRGRSMRLYVDSKSYSSSEKNVELAMVGATTSTAPAAIIDRDVLTEYIRPNPVYDGETLIGYQVYPGTKSGPFAQMGLRGGDVIVEIEGVPLNDPAFAWDVLRQLTDGSVLSGVVKRNGAAQRVTLDGSLILRAEDARSQQVTQAMLSRPGP
jgi:hypothetical protein